MPKYSRLKTNIASAEAALMEILAEGKKPSQSAVEKRAGFTNGTLNYKCDEYKRFKDRLAQLKKPSNDSNELCKTLKNECQKQTSLKDKYRKERDLLKEENSQLHGQNKELIYHLFLIQREMSRLRDGNVVNLDSIKFDHDN